jgi:hypothetical protein
MNPTPVASTSSWQSSGSVHLPVNMKDKVSTAVASFFSSLRNGIGTIATPFSIILSKAAAFFAGINELVRSFRAKSQLVEEDDVDKAKKAFKAMEDQLRRDISGSDMLLDGRFIDATTDLTNRTDLSMRDKYRIMCWATQGGQVLGITHAMTAVMAKGQYYPSYNSLRAVPTCVDTQKKTITIISELRLADLQNDKWPELHSYVFTIEYNYEKNTLSMECKKNMDDTNWGPTPRQHTILNDNESRKPRAEKRTIVTPRLKDRLMNRCKCAIYSCTRTIVPIGRIRPTSEWTPETQSEKDFENAYKLRPDKFTQS